MDIIRGGSDDADHEEWVSREARSYEHLWYQSGPIRVRHPLECRPHRPKQPPKWSPKRDRRDAGSPRRRPERGFHSPSVRVDPELGAVRINFRYAGWQSVTAAYSEKARRQQFFEGPHETCGYRKHEVSTSTLDLQYQPMEYPATITMSARVASPRDAPEAAGIASSGMLP